ncbi:hypothetical protein KCP76_05140 [Salmonella enterica subsp. enterica serovar Weltevreden]|nr:hypothetical protein KCP76_05140 [Salmonella enterica subsp. enterica serovar Weltevreden]
MPTTTVRGVNTFAAVVRASGYALRHSPEYCPSRQPNAARSIYRKNRASDQLSITHRAGRARRHQTSEHRPCDIGNTPACHWGKRSKARPGAGIAVATFAITANCS